MKKILIVEDDQFLGEVLLEKLSMNNFEVKLVKDGAVAIQEMKDFMPNLILLDILLPNLNGYEILEKKFDDESIKNIPVIILSNSGQPVEISRALNLGVKDYLVKANFDPEEVLVKVHQQLEGYSKKDNKLVDNKMKGKTIMWVEDDQFLTDLIKRRMSGVKCDFIHVYDGADVMGKLEEVKPDLIMLDILIPGLNGIEVLSEIKNKPELKDVPIIILSNMNRPDDVEKCKKLGASDFLIKSDLTLTEVFEKMADVIN